MPGTLFRTVLLAAVVLMLNVPKQLAAQSAGASAIPDVIEFNRDIRPILSDNCFFCHGPDKNKREADLRLDTKEGLHGTGAQHGALVAGKPEESELFQRITSTDNDKKMPPVSSGKVLSEHDVQLLKKWIEQGGNLKATGHFCLSVHHSL